ncbi:hypothetical protein BT69DRAFT_1279770, partial [Atractiella rhizophila]
IPTPSNVLVLVCLGNSIQLREGFRGPTIVPVDSMFKVAFPDFVYDSAACQCDYTQSRPEERFALDDANFSVIRRR